MKKNHSAITLLLFFFFIKSNFLFGQYIQQGNKITVTGATQFGRSSKISEDGKTIIVGTAAQGAYVFRMEGNVWTKEAHLLGNGSMGAAVSLSADGNTAIVGGPGDKNGAGGVWIFTRLGTNWTQQGEKLIGTGNVGEAGQGSSVALSANGNTAIVGGKFDNYAIGTGAAWIFTRSGTNWTQQGEKLVGVGSIGTSLQGSSVSLSADGNTAIVGGNLDNSWQGAAWIFIRNNTSWSQQGNKLVGTGSVLTGWQGESVSLSADGNTAILGGINGTDSIGMAFIFARTGTSWYQQDEITAQILAPGNSIETNVSLSGDGKTAIVGAYHNEEKQAQHGFIHVQEIRGYNKQKNY